MLGLAFAVSALHAYFRDVAPILSAALLPWFFMSPIFFEPEAVTSNPSARFVLEWVDPVAPFIGAVRDVVYGGVVPQASDLIYVLVGVGAGAGRRAALFGACRASLRWSCEGAPAFDDASGPARSCWSTPRARSACAPTAAAR